MHAAVGWGFLSISVVLPLIDWKLNYSSILLLTLSTFAYSPLNSIHRILPYKWNSDCPWIVFTVSTCTVHVKANCCWCSVPHSQLTAEVLAAPDNDDDDPFLTSDDDEVELEVNELAVYSTFKWHVIHVCGQCLSNRIPQCNCTRPRLGGVYTYTFLVKNEYFSLRFSLPFTPKRWKRIPKTETFESGNLSGDFENGASENARVNGKNEYFNENGGLRLLIVTCTFHKMHNFTVMCYC